MEREGETPRILLIVEYYIYHIIINTHVDDDVMAQNMTCLVGTPVHNQTVTLPHEVLYIGRRVLVPIFFQSLYS